MSINPFHEGELAVQQRANEGAIAARNGVMIRDTILKGAFTFLRQQRFLVISSRDASGRVWTSLLFGAPGFLEPSADARSLRITSAEATRDSGDPLWANLGANADAGALVIELESRRRLRLNGTASLDPDGIELTVEQCFGNCPKYIHRRAARPGGTNPQIGRASEGTALTAAQIRIIEQADTLFLGTAHPEKGADASHRGGPRGFVTAKDSTTLLIPDYSGNSMFNSLGNIALNPHAGIAIPDFLNGRLLQATGIAETLWQDTDRAVKFTVEQWRESALPSSIRWEHLD